MKMRASKHGAAQKVGGHRLGPVPHPFGGGPDAAHPEVRDGRIQHARDGFGDRGPGLVGGRPMRSGKVPGPPDVARWERFERRAWGLLQCLERNLVQVVVPIGDEDSMGHKLTVERVPSSSGVQTIVASEKATVAPIAKRWTKRFGTYRATNVVAANVPGFVSPKITLKKVNGLFVLDRHDGVAQVLQPVREDVAFTFGLSGTGGRNKGDGVLAKGRTLTWMGVRYER